MEKFLSDLSNPYFLLTAGLFALVVNLLSTAIWGVLIRTLKAVPLILRSQKSKKDAQRRELIRDYVAHPELRDGLHFAITQAGIFGLLLLSVGFVFGTVGVWSADILKVPGVPKFVWAGVPIVGVAFALFTAAFGCRVLFYYLDRTQWILEALKIVTEKCQSTVATGAADASAPL